jgi:hypothetical protein
MRRNTLPETKPVLRVEFWNRNAVFGVTLRYGKLSIDYNEMDNPHTYEFYAKAFENCTLVQEYPTDDHGISVATLILQE